MSLPIHDPPSLNQVDPVRFDLHPLRWMVICLGLLAATWAFALSQTQVSALLMGLFAVAAIETAVRSQRPYWSATGKGAFCFACGTTVPDEQHGRCERCAASETS